MAARHGAGPDPTTFAWAGSLERGAGHYYAVRAPTFLLEYDNVQDDANHVHTVWRDLRGDWGADLLAAHHAGHATPQSWGSCAAPPRKSRGPARHHPANQ